MKLTGLGDRLLGALVPKRTAAAASCPSVGFCSYVRHGCGGGVCVYQYNYGNQCRATYGYRNCLDGWILKNSCC